MQQLHAVSQAPVTGAGAFYMEHSIIGESPAMRAVKEIAAIVARRRSTVMLQGETGAGKEVIARQIHQFSPRRQRPLISVDCSALPDSLFESQMFGHVKGAFTGALRDTLGFVRAADSGTLFLDEIGELTIPMQAKLLRVLQDRRVTPVGSSRPIDVDVRVVCATNRNLSNMVREGTFRQDLYYRLSVVVIQIPPLRERREDIVPLCKHFLALQAALYGETSCELTPEASMALQKFDWPGNVRELANAMECAHVLADSGTIELCDLPEPLRRATGMHHPGFPDAGLRLEDVERAAIMHALKRGNYSKAAASRLLGINIQRLNRRIVRLGIAME
jgi:transcriptional regulator with PAS, ATPase and Fis domain